MYKFFANKKEGEFFTFSEETSKHMKVLRLKNEEILVNFEKEFYLCNFIDQNKAKIIKKTDINNEIGFEVVVALPLIKASNFEIALQKVTELGATKIIPFKSAFTDITNVNIEPKRQRYEKIIFEASQQSFRNIVPTLEQTLTFDELLNLDIKDKILAYEKAKNMPLSPVKNDVLLIVGPEGGFHIHEIEKAKKKCVKIVSLTRSILRAETAIIFMLSRLL
ncbi:16S rRNA (uracil1498-N3)-methyltransferase [Metamycoplasma subdolum]|uniref:Ribosomal RNA small subunit methyltransferase E n=1 Tax=Metamycoplasma subdolum TaxID=92407 RepID=A0A3L9ZYT3_9BACT|nr:16S rRNA (uracil(1498)-N(3))-methyltransferase [Metamycoplasma subdolum]RMA77537.1 16S rRNA (uracil1498-N3)-methyltransferase [Metamycoplasma subdolum]WPB50729.1 16S rRNA (uracil(1498)-N(3))-methyltransferase [Metamycoplasma subdolum]